MDALIPMGLMQSPLGVVMFDAELRVAWVNEAAERLSGGMLTNRWLGRRLGELLPDMDADLIEQSLRRVLATGEPVVDLEVSSRAGGDLSGGCVWGCIPVPAARPGNEGAQGARTVRGGTGPAHRHARLALA